MLNTTILGCHIGFCFGLLASLSCKHGRHLRRANWLLLTDRFVVIGCLLIDVMLIDTYEVFSCRFCLSCLVSSWRKKTSVTMVHGASFDCLTWLYGLFVRTLMSLMNAYASCGRSTLNFIECFWLGSVHSASKLNAKCTQMNYEMNCITMHKCTEMYSKWPIHW